MKNFVRIAALAAALALAAPAGAQERRPTIGLGIGIVPLADKAFQRTPIEVYVPIALAPNFRLEPSLGIFTSDFGGGADERDVTLGVGAFFVKSLAPQADMYVGGRLKLNFARADNGVVDDSGTDFFIAAALGGEYYFVPHFSLGLEGQIGRYDLAQLDVPGLARDDISGFFTTGIAFLRLYF